MGILSDAVRMVIVAVITLGLGACQTTHPIAKPKLNWVASAGKDDFTDEVTKMVTVGSFYINGNAYTQVGKFYPFIGQRNGQLYVGLRSGGTYRIPTGTVQFRIDDNEAFTITPDETPADLIPGTAGKSKATQEEMMVNMTKILSPYTAATGEKANLIVKQMLEGKLLKFRTIGMNQAASSTGEAPLDSSLSKALMQIGINTMSLQ